MPSNKPTACRFCGKPIAYLITKNKKNMPVLWDHLDIEEKKSYQLGIPVPWTRFTNDAPPRDKHMPHQAECEPYQRWIRLRKAQTKNNQQRKEE